jgi:hypothetical protein
LNHRRPNIDRQKEYGTTHSGDGIAFGEAVLISSPPSRNQMHAGIVRRGSAESGFGGRADEKIRTARQAAPLSGRKKSHPQHLTVSLIIIVPRMHNSFCTPSLALRAFYERVRCGQKGRKKIAIVAVARKPLSIMRAMQMSGELFSVGVM